jgi:predicted nucleotidyltransferase
VAALLRRRGIAFALIGAAAMAVHGVARSTRDLDLFTLADECLAVPFWEDLLRTGVEVDIRRGDRDDPLAGVVRLGVGGEHPLDVIVGKSAWQAGILTRARETPIEGVRVPVAARADLILLKLYAGGPHDAWDIAQLLAGPGRSGLVGEVEAALGTLPPECRSLWTRIRDAERSR